MDIRVLYQDEHVYIVDKPEGIATIPERTEREHCLSTLLSAQCGEKLFTVHRLDKEVSGVIVFARTAEAHRALCMQFEHRETAKLYTALVHGLPPEPRGTINTPLRQFGSGRMGVDKKWGKPCETEFEVLERFGNCSLLHARPRTGRRHQIRVHLYSLGHAIIGDTMYGDKGAQKEYKRLMLHSTRLELTLPGDKKIAVDSELPESFTAEMKRLTGAG